MLHLQSVDPVTLGLLKWIQAYVVSGVKVDFVEYSCPWLDDPVVCDGIRLASCRDIAAMKLAAITNRGTSGGGAASGSTHWLDFPAVFVAAIVIDHLRRPVYPASPSCFLASSSQRA